MGATRAKGYLRCLHKTAKVISSSQRGAGDAVQVREEAIPLLHSPPRTVFSTNPCAYRLPENPDKSCDLISTQIKQD